MAREAPIREEDQFFTNEDRNLQYTIDDESDPDPDESSPVDITTFTIEFELKLGRRGAVIFTKTISGGGVTIVSGPAGRVDVDIDDVDTENLKPSDSYFYLLRRVDAGNDLVLSFGDVVLQQG